MRPFRIMAGLSTFWRKQGNARPIGRTCCWLFARAAEDAGFYGDSVVAYDEYLQISPGDDSVRRDRARVLGYTGARLA